MALRKIANLRRPVVHLNVDVCGVFTFPRRFERVIPDSLEIGGLRTGPGAGDKKIPSELKIERFQLRVKSIRRIFNSLVCRKIYRLGSSDVQLDSMEKLLIVSDVSFDEPIEGFSGNSFHSRFAAGCRVTTDVLEVIKIAMTSQKQYSRIGICHCDCVVGNSHVTILGNYQQSCLKRNDAIYDFAGHNQLVIAKGFCFD